MKISNIKTQIQPKFQFNSKIPKINNKKIKKNNNKDQEDLEKIFF